MSLLHTEVMDRDGMADFLRRRRDALQPSDAGLTAGVRRRTAGLRREEVAALANMSTDYYARLEQKRGPQPSEHMIAAIAQALRLTLDERDHLMRLAGHSAPLRLRRTDHVNPALIRMVDRLEDTPALVLTDLGETVLQNRLAVALLGDQMRHTGLARSGYYRWFTDPAERQYYPERDHDHQSRIRAASLRAALTAGGPDRRAAELVDDLQKVSDEFVTIWSLHEVARRFDDQKTIVHPELGEIELYCQNLVSENEAQTLLVLSAAPDTPAYDQLRLLAVVGTHVFDA
jgi:transcriptional regulator with XRE-family HTH domain